MATHRKFLTLTAVVALLCGCGGGSDATLEITIKPRTIDNVGQTATVSVTAVDSSGKAGTGKVTVTSSAGSFKDGITLTLSGGEASADFTCVSATDSTCDGRVTFAATWTTGGKKVEAQSNLTVFVFDAGIPDAGQQVVDAGFPSMQLTAAKTRLLGGIGDSTTVTATIKFGDTLLENSFITFTTTLGAVGELGSTPTTMTYSAVTNAMGQLSAKFVDTGTAGPATITVTSPSLGVHDAVTVNITTVSAISFVSSTCDTTSPCTAMGQRGTGYNETNLIRFKVTGAGLAPVADAPITFAFGAGVADGGVSAPVGASVSATAVTDAMGIAVATVTSGSGIGNFTVTAKVGSAQASTPAAITIQPVRASNGGLSLRCDDTNISSSTGSTVCHLIVNDRDGHPVLSQPTVNVRAESGFIQGPSRTTAGRADFTFAVGGMPPIDTTPLAADADAGRTLEPSITASGLTRNPRDGVITIVASMTGEEWFRDVNGNGVADPGEQFYDQGEAFLDKDDDDVFGGFDSFTDDAPGNGQYDGPNGRWDAQTTIWTTFKIALTGPMAPTVSSLAVKGTTQTSFGTIQHDATTVLDINACDSSLNRVEPTYSLTVRTSGGSQGTAAAINLQQNRDASLGFSVAQNQLLNATGTGPCLLATPVCGFFTRFTSWGLCKIGEVEVRAPAQQVNGQVSPLTVSADVSVAGIPATISSSGTVSSF